MLISIINHTNGQVSDQEAQRVLRAINRQVEEDFRPYWSIAGECRLEGAIGADPDVAAASELRGDAIIYLWDQTDIPGVLGYHSRNFAGIPFGVVFLEVAANLGEPWSVTLSHEVLELLADPHVNLLVQGPHPNPNENRLVYHWYEMCDAVQDETYALDGVDLSNFVLPPTSPAARSRAVATTSSATASTPSASIPAATSASSTPKPAPTTSSSDGSAPSGAPSAPHSSRPPA